jgi:hypothetical protein
LPPVQEIPHPPQFWLLVVVSTQTPAQSVVDGGHAQAPELQIKSPRHTSLQKPQLTLSFWRSTHFWPHCARPEPQDAAHVPSEQTWVLVHLLPQLPQFCGFWLSCTQKPPQSVKPLGQVHVPVMHEAPTGQTVVHVPQWFASVWRLRHVLPQRVSPGPHPVEHTPPEQTWPSWHALAQEPQLRASVCVSTHWPEHMVRPGLHVQLPLTQFSPPPHALPHVPQSKGSLVRSTHASLQSVRPVPQLVVQVPPLHTWLVEHLMPHPPQLSGSLCVSVQTPRQRVPLL